MANYRKSTQGVAHRRCHLSAFDARSINCDSQTPRPAWCEACGKIQKSRNVKKRFIQSADTDASTSSQRSKAIDSVADSFQAFKNRAAAARARYEARKISRAVADERHGCAVKSRENNLTGLAIGQRLPSRGIDDFKEEIRLAQVASHVRCAVHAAAQSHFGHSVVLKDFAAGSLPQPAHQALRHMVAAQNNKAQPAKDADGAGAVVRKKREYLHGQADDARGLLLLHVREGLRWIGGKPMRDRNKAGAGDSHGQLKTNAAFALAGKRNQHPVSWRGHGGDSMRKELQRRLLIRFGNKNALRRAAGAAGVHRHHAADLVLRNTEEPRCVTRDVLRTCERKTR